MHSVLLLKIQSFGNLRGYVVAAVKIHDLQEHIIEHDRRKKETRIIQESTFHFTGMLRS